VDRRIEHILGSSGPSRFVVVSAAGIVVVTAADAGVAYAHGKPPMWPIAVEAGLLFVWMVVRPRLKALERLRADLGGPPAVA
jgi:Na+/proline symporter